MKKREARIHGKLGGVAVVRVALLCTAILFQCVSVNIGVAAQTAGGVNWLDPAGYQKPAFYPITVPDETTCPNKYYVDLASGSGSTCSSGSPCALSGLSGKAGMSGGPAYVYLRGNGYFSWTSYKGSSGNEIVIKPWPGDNTVYYFTATSNGNGGANKFGANGDATSVQYVILDGGPNLQYVFRSSGSSCSSGDVNYDGAIVFNGSYNTLYRVQVTGNGNNCQDLMGQANAGSSTTFTGLKIINCEFHDAIVSGLGDLNQNYGLYAGGGSGCSSGATTLVNFYYLNNIFRNLGSLGIQVEPRNSANGIYISGNAFHDLGFQSCGSKWHCRPAIATTDSCGGNDANVNITNNLIWNTASSCIWPWGGSQYIYNNTCYNYGTASSQDTYDNGIAGYGGSLSGVTVKNNIFDSSGHSVFNGSPTASNNVCLSGQSCGASSATLNANTFLSTSPTSSNFLKIGSGSNAIGAGATLGTVTIDYAGLSRPQGSAYDIGAFAYGPSTVPSPPVIINIQ